MIDRDTSSERAASALAAYNQQGPKSPASLPIETIAKWEADCREGDLSPVQQRDYAWLLTEYGAQLANNGDQTALSTMNTALMLHRKVAENNSHDPLLRAHGLLGAAAVPLIKYSIGLEKSVGRRDISKAVHEYHEGQLLVGQEVEKLLQGPLSRNEQQFCHMLGLLYMVNGLSSKRFFGAPAPPRCYEGVDPGNWLLSVRDWHQGKEQIISTKISDMPYVITVSPEIITPPQELALADGTSLLRAELAVMQNAPNEAVRDAFLLNAASTLHQRLADAFQRRTTLTGKDGSAMRVAISPSVLRAARHEKAPDAISVEGLTADTLLDWYSSQTSPQQFTEEQARTIEKLLVRIELSERVAKLSAHDLHAVVQLHQECAVSLAATNPGAAEAHFTNAAINYDRVISSFEAQDDIESVYQTAFEAAALPILQAIAIKGEGPDALRAKYTQSLEAMLWGLLYDLERADSSSKVRLRTQLIPLLNSLVLTSQSDGAYIALPSLVRQQRSDGGYHIRAWQVQDGKVKLDTARGIQFVQSGTKIEAKDGVAKVPLRLIGQANQAPQFAKELSARLNSVTTNAKKGKSFLDRALPRAVRVLQQAVAQK